MQKKKRVHPGKLASSVQRHARERAEEEARRVPWQILLETRNQYLDWQEFYHWGFLSVGHTDPNRYTQERLRRAELLAIPAAAGILNARLYARADIYGSELERRLADLRQAEVALEQSEEGRRISEEKF